MTFIRQFISDNKLFWVSNHNQMLSGKRQPYQFIKFFDEISIQDVVTTGGKNASLGEMYCKLNPLGIQIPYGFASTSETYWHYIDSNNLRTGLSKLMWEIDKDINKLKVNGEKARQLILTAKFPDNAASEIIRAYQELCSVTKDDAGVAIRSSATAEDLPHASFAGQHDSFLNISGKNEVIDTCKKCFASLFNDRAIKYRINNGFNHMQVALSIGVQQMVRSDQACSGVAFTIEPETGFENLIYITGCWGLGENIVQGAVNPDEFYFFKPSITKNKKSLVTSKLGSKEIKMVYANHKGKFTENIETSNEEREKFVLSEKELNQLAGWCLKIEQHYQMPMDIEWAKDGINNQLFIVQARPETIHGKTKSIVLSEYKLKQQSKLLTKGKAVGNKIISGVARILESSAHAHQLNAGEILITDITNPDWNTILKKSSAIVTNRGGRTSHAAIVARELGVIAIVGTQNATEQIQDGQYITVVCSDGDEGKVYDGQLEYDVIDLTLDQQTATRTKPMLILADTDKSLSLISYPNDGVGLLRMEFAINNSIQVHPMALLKFDELTDEASKQQIKKLTRHYSDKKDYFIDKLSQAVGFVAASFYPKDVIVRMSDFKTNEYANLIGGKLFEPEEENPMLGFRGASRYYSDRYREGFALECAAMKKVRDEMGLTNVKLMIPFCRTVDEGRKVIELMNSLGLKQGENGLEVYVMIEIPSNVILADEFAEIFDGFSIGSNDLTQLTLGIDRDNSIISDLFSEQNAAVKKLIGSVIASAKKHNVKIGLCGQAPSDYPEFARFLVEQGIDSISFNPDALLKGLENIIAAEKSLISITNINK